MKDSGRRHFLRRRVALAAITVAIVFAAVTLQSLRQRNSLRYPARDAELSDGEGRTWLSFRPLLAPVDGDEFTLDAGDPHRRKRVEEEWAAILPRLLPEDRILAVHPQRWHSATGGRLITRSRVSVFDVAVAALGRPGEEQPPRFVVCVAFGSGRKDLLPQEWIGVEVIEVVGLPDGHVPALSHVFAEERERSPIGVLIGEADRVLELCVEALPTDVEAWLRGDPKARPARPMTPSIVPRRRPSHGGADEGSTPTGG